MAVIESKSEKKEVFCKGIIPGTSQKCCEKIAELNGAEIVLAAPMSVNVVITINPPTVRCNVCGYKTRLRYYRSA